MRWLAALTLVMACTEHGKGGGDAWDVRAVALAEAICQNACVAAEEQEQCLADVLMDMDEARLQLPDAAEAQCVDCMRVKTQVMPQIVANQCASTAGIDEQVLAACDLPETDFDQDGDPANDFDEACAGFP